MVDETDPAEVEGWSIPAFDIGHPVTSSAVDLAVHEAITADEGVRLSGLQP